MRRRQRNITSYKTIMRRNCQIFYIKERWVHFENFERRMTQDEKKKYLRI